MLEEVRCVGGGVWWREAPALAYLSKAVEKAVVCLIILKRERLKDKNPENYNTKG